MIRNLLAIVGTLSFIYAWVSLFTIGTLDFGVALAVSMVCVLGLEFCRLLERDKARMRGGREQVWDRRITESLIDDFAGKWVDDTRKETR